MKSQIDLLNRVVLERYLRNIVACYKAAGLDPKELEDLPLVDWDDPQAYLKILFVIAWTMDTRLNIIAAHYANPKLAGLGEMQAELIKRTVEDMRKHDEEDSWKHDE